MRVNSAREASHEKSENKHGSSPKDKKGTARVGASATTTISRKDFGMTWNKALDAGGVLVGDEVAISIDIEAVE
ncbi:MAG: YceI family protein [Candidatus Binataceae bacterium]